MSRYTMHEFTVEFVRETDLAVLVGYEDDEIWLPKSQIEWVGDAEEGDELRIQVPEWLAEEKEMM